MHNDNITHLIAILGSIFFHLVIAAFYIVSIDPIDTPTSIPEQSISVDYVVTEIIEPKKAPVTVIKPTPKKPQSLPGDRSKAVVVKKSDPIYPKEAINYDHEGTVIVRVYISKSGAISKIKLIKSSGHTSLDKAFTQCIRNTYVFAPKRILGGNKRDHVTLSFTFSL